MAIIKDTDMFELMDDVLSRLRSMLHDTDRWDSLVINRRKPHTYRAFTNMEGKMFDGVRVCLHRFEPCTAEEAFSHPHPWPGAFWVAEGSYRMIVGRAADELAKFDHCLTLDLAAGSSYAMTDELTSHSVQPLETCWSVMVNLPPWDKQHKDAPTTKGKDLEKMSPDELQAHLDKFKRLVT